MHCVAAVPLAHLAGFGLHQPQSADGCGARQDSQVVNDGHGDVASALADPKSHPVGKVFAEHPAYAGNEAKAKAAQEKKASKAQAKKAAQAAKAAQGPPQASPAAKRAASASAPDGGPAKRAKVAEAEEADSEGSPRLLPAPVDESAAAAWRAEKIAELRARWQALSQLPPAGTVADEGGPER